MPKPRRKTSAPYNDFIAEINRLVRLDSINQKAYSLIPQTLSKSQLELLTEANFLYMFRAYEKFIGEIFLLYCSGKPTRSGRVVKSYLKPKDYFHSLDLILSAMSRVEWNDPDTVLERAKVYLETPNPIYDLYSTEKKILTDLKFIRNHIAHASDESFTKYVKRLKSYNSGITPLNAPSPGSFLLQNDPRLRKYRLQIFAEKFKEMADFVTI